MQKRQRPMIYGDGLQTRDFTFVENVVSANLAACACQTLPDDAIFNCACGGRHSLLDLVTNLNEIIGVAVKPKLSNPRPGDVRDSFADISRAVNFLGYEVNVSFPEGLRRTVEWFSK